ncbi:MAG TPA: hypothetical protein VNH64_01430, partial [Parvularculaceae bacterium]|nr:hypothetical protein [Parvularculaceae bacterium]
MNALWRYALAVAAGAAVAAIAFAPSASGIFPWRLSFPPDLVFALDVAGVSGRAAASLAGAGAGLAIAVAVDADLPAIFLAFLSPLTIFALGRGAGGALLFAGVLFSARGLASLPGDKRPAPVIGLGLAIALAPYLTNAMLAATPIIIAFAGVLSPWRGSARRMIGFVTAISAPLIMAIVCTLYLSWLFGAPEGVALSA